jgi:hypothetical protein
MKSTEEKKNQIKNNVLWVGFMLTFIIHLVIWTQVENLQPNLIIKFYLFLGVMFMMLVTLINIINRTVPEFLGLSFIGIILLKFVLMYLIRMKLNFEEVPHYKYHFIIPYFVLTGLLTYYTIQLLNQEKKH